jgi:hypothetical protein
MYKRDNTQFTGEAICYAHSISTAKTLYYKKGTTSIAGSCFWILLSFAYE